MASPTAQETSSKVYLRYYDFNKYYDIEKKLPNTLDAAMNGGKKYSMTSAEWLELCKKIDACFYKVNTMQSIIFFSKLAIVLSVFVYIFVVYIAFFWRLRISLILVLLGLLAAVILINCYVQGPMNKVALEQAKEICREKTTDLNLQAGEESAILIELHYRDWKPFKCLACENYEVDSNDNTRNAFTYILISRGSDFRSQELPSIASFYRKNDPEYPNPNETAPNIDEFEGPATDVENQNVATAVQLDMAQFEPQRREANMEPYVKVPMAKAKLYQNVEQSDNEVVHDVETVLPAYVND